MVVSIVPQHHTVVSRRTAQVVLPPAETLFACRMPDSANAVVRTNVPIPSCPALFAPVHHTLSLRTTHVCASPAATDERDGVLTKPGPTNEVGKISARAKPPIAVTATRETAANNFIENARRCAHASEQSLQSDVGVYDNENGVYPGATKGHGCTFSINAARPKAKPSSNRGATI